MWRGILSGYWRGGRYSLGFALIDASGLRHSTAKTIARNMGVNVRQVYYAAMAQKAGHVPPFRVVHCLDCRTLYAKSQYLPSLPMRGNRCLACHAVRRKGARILMRMLPPEKRRLVKEIDGRVPRLRVPLEIQGLLERAGVAQARLMCSRCGHPERNRCDCQVCDRCDMITGPTCKHGCERCTVSCQVHGCITCRCTCVQLPLANPVLRWHGDSGRYTGLELEYRSVPGAVDDRWRAHCTRWGIGAVIDGSLHGEVPREVVLSPARGPELVRQVTGTVSLLTELEAEPHPEAGTHIHVDARDHSGEHVARVAWLWAHLEPVIWRCLPEHRQRNRHCRPMEAAVRQADVARARWRDHTLWLGTSAPTQSGGALGRDRVLTEDRYRTLNLASMTKHKTLEYRAFPSTLDANALLHWTTLVTRVTEAARYYRVRWLRRLLKRNDPVATLEALMPTETMDFLESEAIKYHGESL